LKSIVEAGAAGAAVIAAVAEAADLTAATAELRIAWDALAVIPGSVKS
jgi:thiamine monophosphate synthase